MGEKIVEKKIEEHKAPEWCPICGTKPSKLTTGKKMNICPQCGFDFNLITSPQESPLPENTPAYVPFFALALVILQIILAVITGFAFLFLANFLYFPSSLIIAGLQLSSVILLAIIIFLLYYQIRLSTLRIVLIVIGVITLPIGVCVIAAGLAIASPRRWCVICRKRIHWSQSSLNCPHCESYFHRWGLCRNLRYQTVADHIGYNPSKEVFDRICPKCFQSISDRKKGGDIAD